MFPDDSQGPILQSDLSKDSRVSVLSILLFFFFHAIPQEILTLEQCTVVFEMGEENNWSFATLPKKVKKEQMGKVTLSQAYQI